MIACDHDNNRGALNHSLKECPAFFETVIFFLRDCTLSGDCRLYSVQ